MLPASGHAEMIPDFKSSAISMGLLFKTGARTIAALVERSPNFLSFGSSIVMPPRSEASTSNPET